jgi:predicted O-methyltransferase YrrM
MNIETKKVLSSAIFNNLRTLHGVTPQDTYIENYKWHKAKWGDKFFDLYTLAFWWGGKYQPKNILEIGSRTGLSLCQLLSAYLDYSDMRACVFDLYDDGLSTPELTIKHLEHLAIPTHFFEFYQGDSRTTVPEFKKTNTTKFDWILVDGGHTQELATIDLENVVDLVAKGGVIVFDDICATEESDGFNLRPSWDKFKENHLNDFKWFEDTNGKGIAWAVKL